MKSREICADTISEGWLRAAACVYENGPLFHLLVRMTDQDDPAVRARVNALLKSRGEQSVETVANTIFPSAIAAASADHAELTERYRRMYPKLKQVAANKRGTYFGRMVAFPDPTNGPIDQIGTVIRKLRVSLNGQALTSCYEIPVVAPAEDVRLRMAFPCLSYVSFHLEDRKILHLFAAYRNHFMVQRAYGNYVGLRALQEWVASSVGVSPGELAVLSGHAEIDGHRLPVKQLLRAEGVM